MWSSQGFGNECKLALSQPRNVDVFQERGQQRVRQHAYIQPFQQCHHRRLTAKPLIEGGQLRALAVTGLKRADGLPDIPTVAEAGVPNYEALQWYGLLAPTGTPPEIVARIQAETALALKLPDMKARLASDGAEPVGSTPSDFARFIKDEHEKWTNVARVANIKPD